MSSTSTTWTTDTNTKSGTVQIYSSNVSVLKVVADEGENAILDLFADEGDDNADKWRMWVNASDDDLHFSNYTSGTAWTDILTIQDGGNVGIGTDSPAVLLDVHGATEINSSFGRADDATTYIAVRTAETQNNIAGITFGVGDGATAANTGVGSATELGSIRAKVMNSGGVLQGQLDFFTNTGDNIDSRMTIMESGNVGIGIAAPAQKLHVFGDPGNDGKLVTFQNSHADVDDDDIILFLQWSSDVDASAGHFIQFADNNHTNMGAIIADSATASAAAHSDYRSKENISLMSSGLAEINDLKPSKFNFKNHTKVMNGFIAHEVQEVIPGAVFGVKDAVDDDGEIKPQLLAMEKLIPFMVKAIQELSVKVTALENA